ncbi:hypothetical protein NHP22001_14150 [Helicobacter sp. NHP22-001]|nr:hypothetical protein NHP22001_14150 [Helicobacter sp. NHP22-001]
MAPVVQKPTPKVTKETTKAPILAKDLSIANRGKIIMHNNIYKVNLGT